MPKMSKVPKMPKIITCHWFLASGSWSAQRPTLLRASRIQYRAPGDQMFLNSDLGLKRLSKETECIAYG